MAISHVLLGVSKHFRGYAGTPARHPPTCRELLRNTLCSKYICSKKKKIMVADSHYLIADPDPPDPIFILNA
jgi:hypothetical protein